MVDLLQHIPVIPIRYQIGISALAFSQLLQDLKVPVIDLHLPDSPSLFKFSKNLMRP